jgi:ABC-type transport system substrate-binding protein
VTTYNLLLVSSASWNEAQWNNEEFDEAVANAQAATTQEDRVKYLEKCQKIMHDKGPYIVPFLIDELGANQGYVENYYQDITSSYPADHTWNIWLEED